MTSLFDFFLKIKFIYVFLIYVDLFSKNTSKKERGKEIFERSIKARDPLKENLKNSLNQERTSKQSNVEKRWELTADL